MPYDVKQGAAGCKGWAVVNDKGELKGFSVGAFPENLIPKSLFKDVKEGEWFALAVSIVKMPYYPEMIFKVFKPDEYIKKHIMEETTMTDEDKNAYGLFR